MSIDYKLIGNRIKENRKHAGITQEKLAEKLSVTVGYVSQIERGITKVSLDTLSNICLALNCNIEYLVAGVSIGSNEYLCNEIYSKTYSLNNSQKQMLLEMLEIIKKY